MFRHEDMQQLFSKLDITALGKHSCPNYHRGSLAALLRFVRDRGVLNWEEVMKVFLDLVENDTTILMGMNYMQELYLQLHILKVYTVSTLQPPFNHYKKNQGLKSLCAWDDLPPAVCITLKIPRTKLQVFSSLPPAKLGTPIVRGILQSSDTSFSRQWQNIFAAVHLAFGDIMTYASRDEENFKLSIVKMCTVGWELLICSHLSM